MRVIQQRFGYRKTCYKKLVKSTVQFPVASLDLNLALFALRYSEVSCVRPIRLLLKVFSQHLDNTLGIFRWRGLAVAVKNRDRRGLSLAAQNDAVFQ